MYFTMRYIKKHEMLLFNTSKKASIQFFLHCERCELKSGPGLSKQKLYKSWMTNGLKFTLSTIMKVYRGNCSKGSSIK